MHTGVGKLATQLLRSLAAIVVGYVVMVIGTTVVQENLLGGHVSYMHSPTSVLIIGAILTPLAALFGGFITGAIAGRAPIAHVIPMVVAIAAETSYFYLVSHPGSDPLWFRVGAALALILGAIVGAWIWRALATRRGKVAVVSI